MHMVALFYAVCCAFSTFKKLIFTFLAIRIIGFSEIAIRKSDFGKAVFEKLVFRKMDIREKQSRGNGFRDIGIRENGHSGGKIGKTDFGRFVSRFWAPIRHLCLGILVF